MAGPINVPDKVGAGVHRAATNKLLGAILTPAMYLPDGMSMSTASGATAALQALMTAAYVTGNRAYIPASAYQINDTISVPEGVEVYGDLDGTVIEQTVTLKNIFTLGHNAAVRSMRLKMPVGADNGLDSQNGVYADSKTNVTASDLRIEAAGRVCGIQFRNCKNVSITDNMIWNGAHVTGAPTTISDILLYSGSGGGRIKITGNFCLSNNKNGILADALGYDADITVANNFCITLDPATCTDGGAWSEVASGGVRRHGIVVGYLDSQVGGPRAIVANNHCRNTIWTGIYLQGLPSSQVIVIGNYCSKNGYEQSQSISGGINVGQSDGGHATIIGNVVEDFQNTTTGTAAISINGEVSGVGGATILGNTIRNSEGQGVCLYRGAKDCKVADNTIIGSALEDIAYIASAGTATLGGHSIENNKIVRTRGNAIRSIYLSPQDGLVPSRVRGNSIRGFDNSNAVRANAGISVDVASPYVAIIEDNLIENFNVGITYAAYWANATRHIDAIIARNKIRNCTYGIGAAATQTTSVLPVSDNEFYNVTNPVSSASAATVNGNKVAYIADRKNGRLIVYELNAAPTVGTWAVGDRAEFTTPTAGASPGSVCTTAGNPGTWKAMPSLAA